MCACQKENLLNIKVKVGEDIQTEAEEDYCLKVRNQGGILKKGFWRLLIGTAGESRMSSTGSAKHGVKKRAKKGNVQMGKKDE